MIVASDPARSNLVKGAIDRNIPMMTNTHVERLLTQQGHMIGHRRGGPRNRRAGDWLT